jgi:hypothetical protein
MFKAVVGENTNNGKEVIAIYRYFILLDLLPKIKQRMIGMLKGNVAVLDLLFNSN